MKSYSKPSEMFMVKYHFFVQKNHVGTYLRHMNQMISKPFKSFSFEQYGNDMNFYIISISKSNIMHQSSQIMNFITF